MAEQYIECSSACTVTVVHEFPLFSLSIAEGAAIGSAIVSVWALAWGFRQVFRLFMSRAETSKED